MVLLNIETGDEVIRISENDEIKRIVYSADDENIIKNTIAKGISLFTTTPPDGHPPQTTVYQLINAAIQRG